MHEGRGDVKMQQVNYTTFQKWQHELDCEYQTMSGLDCSSEPAEVQSVQRLCGENLQEQHFSRSLTSTWLG